MTSWDGETGANPMQEPTKAPELDGLYQVLKRACPDIPKDFSEMVYADWIGRGCQPRYPDYCRKRWMKSEGMEWKAGRHSEQVRRGKMEEQPKTYRAQCDSPMDTRPREEIAIQDAIIRLRTILDRPEEPTAMELGLCSLALKQLKGHTIPPDLKKLVLGHPKLKAEAV